MARTCALVLFTLFALAAPGTRCDAQAAAVRAMTSLDGTDETFRTLGTRSFAHPVPDCFHAVVRTFQNFGHRVDRKDPDSRTVILWQPTCDRS